MVDWSSSTLWVTMAFPCSGPLPEEGSLFFLDITLEEEGILAVAPLGKEELALVWLILLLLFKE